MNAFRFLSLITVGFTLLVFVFLLNATQGRMEAEATRWVEGPELALEAGNEVEWTLNLGAPRIEEAWPAPQRQPRLFLMSKDAEGLAEAQVVVDAMYLEESGASHQAFISGAQAAGVPGEEPGQLAFGPLWMSWEHDLVLKVRVEGAVKPGATAQLVLRGEATSDYIAARSMARTLWFVFVAIAAGGFAGLMLTVKDGSAPAVKA